MKTILFILISFNLISCTKNNFPKYVELSELRILALKASSPEVNPGSTVNITPYISDINNSGNLTYSWQSCLDPGVGSGAEPECDTASTITQGTVTGLNAANSFTNEVNSFTVTIPNTTLAGRNILTSFNGVGYLVVYSVTDPQGNTVSSFKRITVSTSEKTTKNQNPSIAQVLANGQSFAQLSLSTDYLLTPVFNLGEEPYSYYDDNGNFKSQTERIQNTWFYSDGNFKYYRTFSTDENLFTSPSTYPTSRNAFLVLVSRDGRGGIDFKKMNID